jgi:hypothetical protein
MAVTSRSSRGRNVAVALSAGVFLVATTSAVVAALLLGTTLGPGILVVGTAFGFCFAVGSALHTCRALNYRTGAFPLCRKHAVAPADERHRCCADIELGPSRIESLCCRSQLARRSRRRRWG